MAGPFLFWLYRENCSSLHFDYPTRTEVDKGQAFVIRTKNSYQLFLRLRRRPHSSQRDNFDFIEYKKCSDSSEHFLLSLEEQLSLPLRASEVIFDSEVHIVSEVSP